MRSNPLKRMLAAKLCLLLLGVLLLLTACGGQYQNPGPNSTPSNGGYNIIYMLDHEMQIIQTLHWR